MVSASLTGLTFISSVTSINLRTITFTPHFRDLSQDALLCRSTWAHLDDVLCGLVKKMHKLGYDRTLELVFRFESVSFDPDLDYPAFMPRFRENGRVRILDTSNGKIFGIVVRFFHDCTISLFLNHGPVNRATRRVIVNR